MKIAHFSVFFLGVCHLFPYSTSFPSNEKNKFTSTKSLWEKNSEFPISLNINL